MSLSESTAVQVPSFATLPIDRDRDRFTRELLRELSGLLEETVGLEEASGFISEVGSRIGRQMNAEYRGALDVESLSLEQVAATLVDLKARIAGGFRIESIDGQAIVLTNDACPFGRYVEGRVSLCMMTSNVFGRIAADNLGYSRVEIQESIAAGHDGCRVVVHLGGEGPGREYFGD